MTFQEIINRDSPTAVTHARELARQGITGPLRLYYRHEALALQSEAISYDMARDGWTPTEHLLPSSLPYDRYACWIRDHAASLPIF